MLCLSSFLPYCFPVSFFLPSPCLLLQNAFLNPYEFVEQDIMSIIDNQLRPNLALVDNAINVVGALKTERAQGHHLIAQLAQAREEHRAQLNLNEKIMAENSNLRHVLEVIFGPCPNSFLIFVLSIFCGSCCLIVSHSLFIFSVFFS